MTNNSSKKSENIIEKEITTEIKKIISLQAVISRRISKAPQGSLRISKCKQQYQYYHMPDNPKDSEYYLSKKKMKLIKALAQKSFDIKLSRHLATREESLHKVLKLLKKDPDITLPLNCFMLKTYNSLSPGRKALIEAPCQTDEDFAEVWQSESYTGLPIYDYDSCFETERGERVRSKTEKMIADKLYYMGIPYRYEYPHYINGLGTVYSDFTILNKRTRREWIFEHFGMMDDPDYSAKAAYKINQYIKNGYLPGESFLFTMESSLHPFDYDLFCDICERYLI